MCSGTGTSRGNRPGSWGGVRVANGVNVEGGGFTRPATRTATRRYVKTSKNNEYTIEHVKAQDYRLYVNGQELRYRNVRHGSEYYVQFTTEAGLKNTVFSVKSFAAAKQIMQGIERTKRYEITDDEFHSLRK